MKKRALLCGINYPNTNHALNGCVNDVLLMEKILREKFDFKDVTLLIDNAATTTNILIKLDELVHDAQPGDVLYFHYSGHGSQMLDDSDPDHEPDGLDEIICPIDLDWKNNVIRDDDLKRIFDKVPAGVNLTVMLDCCNSGGGMDHLNQYQYEIENAPIQQKQHGRFLPPPDEQKMVLLERRMGFKKRAATRDVNKTSLLISGCRSHQTSADAFIAGKYHGAATYAVYSILEEHNYDISYKDLIEKVNKWVYHYQFTQRPELNGPRVLFEKKFLSHYVTESDDSKEEDVISQPNQNQHAENVSESEDNANVQEDGNGGTGDSESGDMTISTPFGNTVLHSESGKDEIGKWLIIAAIIILSGLLVYLLI